MKVDLDILIRICNALDVDIERFYTDYIKTTHNTYSENELSILNKYRQLNEIGKEKAKTYIDDLLINNKYTEETTIQENKPTRRTPSLKEAMEMQKPRPIRSDRLDDDGYERIAAYGRGVRERKKKE